MRNSILKNLTIIITNPVQVTLNEDEKLAILKLRELRSDYGCIDTSRAEILRIHTVFIKSVIMIQYVVVMVTILNNFRYFLQCLL